MAVFTPRLGVHILSLCGILLCIYTLHVEIKKDRDENYEAMCDISEHVSCSKVFLSYYGKGFGIVQPIFGEKHWLNQPNPIFGLAFYCMQIVMTEQKKFETAVLQVIFAIIANLGSLYLASVLVFVLHDVCLVCITTYVVNFVLLVFSVKYAYHLRMKSKAKLRFSKKSQ